MNPKRYNSLASQRQESYKNRDELKSYPMGQNLKVLFSLRRQRPLSMKFSGMIKFNGDIQCYLIPYHGSPTFEKSIVF